MAHKARHTFIMGILDGAATDLQSKLESVGVRRNLAYALGQLAYARRQDVPAWVAPPIVSKAEIAWLVSEYVKHLRQVHHELPRITFIQGLCTKVFGPYGEMMFVGSYPEFSEDQWEATLVSMLGGPSAPSPIPQPGRVAVAFSKDLLESLWYWNQEAWIQDGRSEQQHLQMLPEAASAELLRTKRIALLARMYFDTPRDGIGRYQQGPVVDAERELDDFSLTCQLDRMAMGAAPLHGWLVISGDRMGFFDVSDLEATAPSQGDPLLFSTDSISRVTLEADRSVLSYTPTFAKIQTSEVAGLFQLAVFKRDGGIVKVTCLPELLITDVHRSTFFGAMHFLQQLDDAVL